MALSPPLVIAAFALPPPLPPPSEVRDPGQHPWFPPHPGYTWNELVAVRPPGYTWNELVAVRPPG